MKKFSCIKDDSTCWLILSAGLVVSVVIWPFILVSKPFGYFIKRKD